MTLADIVNRGVQVEWHEAVAVVRPVAEWGASGESAVPELHEVELLPNGQVEVVGGAVVDDPVDWLVQMLQTLMGAENVPPHIAELMAQPHESLQAFSQALGYFERPNRAAILQDLYSRASGSPPSEETANADELIASLRATALPPAPDDAGEKAQSVSHRRRVYYAAGGLALVGAVLIGAGLARRRDDGSAAATAPATLTHKVSAKVTGAADAVAGAVVSALGGGTAQRSAAEKPKEVEKPKEETVPTSRPTRDRGSVKPDASALPPSAPTIVKPGAVRKDDVSQPKRVDAPQRAAPDERVIRAQDPADPIVYSASSPDVSEPVGIRPQLPKGIPPGLKPEDLARIELVISPDGTVASVKILGQPRTVHDSMLLSAAKSWRFRPATKDGTPVPYRLTIWVPPGLVPGSRRP